MITVDPFILRPTGYYRRYYLHNDIWPTNSSDEQRCHLRPVAPSITLRSTYIDPPLGIHTLCVMYTCKVHLDLPGKINPPTPTPLSALLSSPNAQQYGVQSSWDEARRNLIMTNLETRDAPHWIGDRWFVGIKRSDIFLSAGASRFIWIWNYISVFCILYSVLDNFVPTVTTLL